MISPVIHFPGTCKEAIRFYEEVFVATDKHIAYYKDAPPDPGFVVTEDMRDLVMHAGMTICGTAFNFSDTQEETVAGSMICFNVFLQSADEVCRAYERLREGGRVIVALGPQFFSAMYGSVEDRYGIRWQLIS